MLKPILSIFFICALAGAQFFPFPGPGVRAPTPVIGWFVSPTGSDASCLIDAPCSLEQAMSPAQTAQIQPGDTVWLRGGDYDSTQDGWMPLQVYVVGRVGTSGSPITFRSYPGEKARILNGIEHTTGARYVRLRDLEITDAYPASRWESVKDSGNVAKRPAVMYNSVAGGVDLGHSIINCVIHDSAHPGIWWPNIRNGEIYGSLIFNNGELDDESAGWDHTNPWVRGSGLYGQNDDLSQPVNVEASIWFRNFTTGVNFYGESGYVAGVTTQDNIAFQNGDSGIWHVVKGTNQLNGLTIDNNVSYQALDSGETSSQVTYYEYDQGTASITNNYFVGGTACPSCSVAGHVQLETLTFTGNTVVGPEVLVYQKLPSDGTATVTWNNNAYYGGAGTVFQPFSFYDSTAHYYNFADWKTNTGYDAASTWQLAYPTTTVIRYIPVNKYKDQYDSKRLHVAVINWADTDTVQLDLDDSAIPADDRFAIGSRYTIYDAQCYLSPCQPLATGTFNGTAITVSMTSTAIDDPTFGGVDESPFVNARVLAHTSKQFGAFVIFNQ